MPDPLSLIAPSLASLGLSTARPLVLIDVDEVLGLFMQGFGDFLKSHDLEMRIDRFALFQNIYRPGATEHLDLAEGKKLFDAFFSTKQGGLGMGLAISRTIVENHGGRLWLDAAVESGARFVFNIPSI